MTGQFPPAPPPSGRHDDRKYPADVWRWIADCKALLPAKRERQRVVPLLRTPTEPEPADEETTDHE